MRQLKKIILYGTVISILLLAFFGAKTILKEDNPIIGDWVSLDDSNWKLTFSTESTCIDYYEGENDDTYTYFLTEELADNGVVFSYLKLVNVNDSNDIYNYEINGLTQTRLVLNYLGDLNEKLLQFERQ